MKPIIKYAGGKQKELSIIKPFFPEFEFYVEPFVGGGSVFFNLEKENSVINDLNTNLIDFYKAVAHNREKLISELKTLENTEECYYRIRDMFNKKIESDYLRATLFAYINRTAFNGMVRYNQKGEMNVSFGRYKTYHPWDFFTEEASELLKTATIRNDSFEKLFEDYNDEKYFFYCDPPYLGEFKDYGGLQTFTEEAHLKLFECFKNTKSKVMINISDVGIIPELYKDYIKHEYEKTYSFNIKNRMEDTQKVKHLIITNY